MTETSSNFYRNIALIDELLTTAVAHGVHTLSASIPLPQSPSYRVEVTFTLAEKDKMPDGD
jgi:hypothetical protein